MLLCCCNYNFFGIRFVIISVWWMNYSYFYLIICFLCKDLVHVVLFFLSHIFFYCFVCHLLLLSNWGLEIVHMYFRFIVLWCFCSCSWHLEFFTCTSELCASVRFQHLFCGGFFFFHVHCIFWKPQLQSG